MNRRGMMTVVLAGTSFALLAACATPGAPRAESKAPTIVVDSLEIRNELPYPVTDVIIQVPETGAFAGCGNILPGSRCFNRFEDVDYSASDVVITWQEHGQPHSTGDFRLELPDLADPAAAYLLEVIVFAPGQAGARFVPVTE